MVFIDDDEEEVKPKKKTTFPLSMYVSEGKYYHKLSQFQTALACFKEGLRIDPENVPCLLGKAKCLIRLGHYDEASACADEVLKVNPESPEACYLKGDAQYYRGNFEESFAVFLESSTKRPNKNNLKKGNQLCTHAIDNYSPEVLSRVEKDEVKMKKKTTEDKPPKSKRSKIPYSNVALLRRAYYTDIKFTESLLEDVKDSANAACQDLWEYLNTLRKVRKSQHPKKSRKQAKSIEHQLHECEEAYKEGDTRACLFRGFETLEALDRLPSDQTKRQKARVFHLMGLSYISRDDLDSAMEFLSKELKISDEMDDDAPGLKFRSWRAIGEVHLKSQRYDEAKDAFRNCLQWPTADSGEEEDFLWCQMKEGYTPSETLEGSTSEEEGSVGGENCLMDFDLQMLLATIAVRERRMDDAKAIYRDALRIAKRDNDSKAEEEVRNQIKMLDVESVSRSIDENHNTTNTDDSEDSMVTCLEELLDNVSNDTSQDNSSQSVLIDQILQ